MKTMASKVALALVGAGVIAAVPAAAGAAQQQAAPAPAPAERQWNLSKEERAALTPVQEALSRQDFAAAGAALPTARTAAKGADARYLVGHWQLEVGRRTNNPQAQAQGIEEILASGGAQASELPGLYGQQAAYAGASGDKAKVESALARVVELQPNNPDMVAALAEAKYDNGKAQEAVATFDRAIAMKAASGQPVPENWYKRALSVAYTSKLVPQSLTLSRAWVGAYPTPKNWRDALLIYRELAITPQVSGATAATGDALRTYRAIELDNLRLMRTAKALSGERDYYDLADRLNEGGYPGEAQAVINEGVAARMVDATRPDVKDRLAAIRTRAQSDRASLAASDTKARAAANGTPALQIADAYLGYGDYAKAADLYRVALQKGSVDANLVNTRLGMALGLAGQKAEAEAAFRAVTGPRAELANYWLVWLSRNA